MPRADARPTVPSRHKPTRTRCGPLVPARACAMAKRQNLGGTVRVCAGAVRSDQRRIGRWDYALIAPHYTSEHDVSLTVLRTMWTSHSAGARLLAIDREAAALFTKRWGARGPGVFISQAPRPRSGNRPRWAIIAADTLTPAWQPIRIAGTFALDRDDKSPIGVDLCGDEPALTNELRNIDANKTTLLTMTGVTAMTRNTGMLMQQKGLTYPAKDIAHWFRDSDDVHVSNEVAFRTDCEHRKHGTVFCSRDEYIRLLETIGANIIELTGSHLTDHGRKWISHTLELYRKRGWRWFGGGNNQAEATRPLRIEHNGNRIALLGCNLPRTENHFIRDAPGEALCDYERMRWQVQKLRREGYLPIVSIQHWEHNQYRAPRRLIREFRPFAEAGAVMVFGSQAHQPHPFELHYGAFIHYGSGNLFFDMMFSLGTRQGVLDRLYFHDGRLLSVEQRFTLIQEGGRPVPMTAPQRRWFLERLAHEAKRIWPHAKPNAKPDLTFSRRTRPQTYVSVDGKLIVPYLVREPEKPSKRRGLLVQLDGQEHTIHDHPYVIVASRLKATRRWRTGEIAQFLRHLIDTYGIDKRRVYFVASRANSAGERFCLRKQVCRFLEQLD